jgi:hypothetical protein
MPKKKPKPRFTMLQIVGTVAAVLGLAGGFITLENHWVSYPYHGQSTKSLKAEVDLDLAQLSKAVEQIQRNASVKSAQDEVFFWMKQESQFMEVKARLGKSPSKEFDVKYQEATFNRKMAEDRLKKLQESK